eukprot:g36994.t1
MWEVRVTNVNSDFTCEKYTQVQLLTDCIRELDMELDEPTSFGRLRSGQVSGSEAQKGRGENRTAIVIGDSLVRGTDRRFCGTEQDSWM